MQEISPWTISGRRHPLIPKNRLAPQEPVPEIGSKYVAVLSGVLLGPGVLGTYRILNQFTRYCHANNHIGPQSPIDRVLSTMSKRGIIWFCFFSGCGCGCGCCVLQILLLEMSRAIISGAVCTIMLPVSHRWPTGKENLKFFFFFFGFKVWFYFWFYFIFIFIFIFHLF